MNQIHIAIIEDSPSDVERLEAFCKAAMEELKLDFKTHVFKNEVEYEERSQEILFSLLILDIDLKGSGLDRSGWDILKSIVDDEFIPVIVYSGHVADPRSHMFKDLLIEIVLKGAGVDLRPIIIKFIQIKTQFTKSKDQLFSEFQKISHTSIEKLLGHEYTLEMLDDNIILHLAYSRITSYLLNVPPSGAESFPPESIFIYPCLDIPGYPLNTLFLGTILRQNLEESDILWLVVSPSCDMIYTGERQPKIKSVLLLKCYSKFDESFVMRGIDPKQRRDHLRDGIRNKKYIILKCPQHIFGAKTLLLSFKDYTTFDIAEIHEGINGGSWHKIASIAVPYAESIQNLFLGDVSRIGTPYTSSQDEELDWADVFLTKNYEQ